MILSTEQILAFLPHRDRFLMISGAEITGRFGHKEDLQQKDSVHAWWDLPADSWVVEGHFPNDPLVPGVLITEAMAQSCGLLARCYDAGSRGRPVLLVSVNNVRFSKPVRLPCRIELWPNLLRIRGPIWKFMVTANVDGDLVARGEIVARLLETGEKRSGVGETDHEIEGAS